MKDKSGFTLIELSIVLVIIGLLVGGVLVGDLIRAAEIRSITADKERYLTAINTYRLKYNAIPGDHASAETFFGASNTNNGNGNKRLAHPIGSSEVWLFWQHMALAGLIEGSYTGATGGAGPFVWGDAVIDSNVPAAKKSGVGYSIYYENNATGTLNDPFGGGAYHMLIVGKDNFANNYLTFGGAFSVEDVNVLDQKIDDGVASSGIVRTSINNIGLGSVNCSTGVAPNHDYYTGSADSECHILFMFNP